MQKKNEHFTHVGITKQVKEILLHHDVVLPQKYATTYVQIAKEHQVTLTPAQLFCEEMLDERVVQHLISLSRFTHLAIKAIHEKNEHHLSTILHAAKKLHQEIDELKQIAFVDNLTACFNRKWFEDNFLDKSNNHFIKDGTLVFVDLNRLKRINDDYGHVVGDKVIKYLAHQLKNISPSVIRYGGDEFLLIYEDQSLNGDIEIKMSTLLDFFEKVAFKTEDKEFKVSFAFGIATFKREHELNTILDRADKKMYQFKEGKRKIL